MALQALKQAQKLDRKSKQLYIDSEQTFSADWCEKLGIDTSRVVVIDGEDASDAKLCFELLLGVPREDKAHFYDGKIKEGFLDKVAKGELNYNLVILDSLGSLIVPADRVAEIGKVTMARTAMFLTTTMKKISLEVAKANIPFIIINHTKDNLDLYGSDHKSTGGNSFKHALSCIIYFEPIGGKAGQILDEQDNRIGQTIRATVEKSKFGPFPRKCEFKVIFTQGIVSGPEEIGELASKYEVVQKPSAQMIEYKENKWRGKDAFSKAISESEPLQKELLKLIEHARDTAWEKQRKLQEAKKAEVLEIDEEVVEEAAEE